MRKTHIFASLLLVIVLLIGAALPALSANASDIAASRLNSLALSEATSLARFMPADAVIYATARVDDAYIDTLDGLFKQLNARLPQPQAMTLRSALEAALKQAGYDYAQDIRPWLGDRVAVGLGAIDVLLDKDPTNDVSVPLVVAIDVTDQAKAEAFVDGLLKQGNLSQTLPKTTEGAYTAYRSLLPTLPINILVGKDVLLIGTATGVEAATGSGAKLADDANFKATVGLLTAGSYNLLAYVNPTLLATIVDMSIPATNPEASTLKTILGALGPIALGTTILDGRSLVLDIAGKKGDFSKLEALGFSMKSAAPIDLSFAANIPAGTTLYLQAKDLKSSYDNALKNLGAAAALQKNAGQNLDKGLAQASAMIKAATGLDLDQDILGWMTGNYGFFFSYVPAASGAPSIFRSMIDPASPSSADRLDLGLVVQATDAAKAKNLANKLGAFVEKALAKNPMIKVSQEQIGGAAATVIAVSVPTLAKPLELVIGANDKVFVLATRTAATAILSGAPGLDTAPGFAEAKAYLLPNATALGYADPSVSGLLADVLAVQQIMINRVFQNIVGELQNASPTPNANTLSAELQTYEKARVVMKGITDIFSSGSYSTADTQSDDSLVRFVLTLAK